MSEFHPSSVAICVLSFDGASELWRPFFDHFKRAWPDVPYPVYLLSNHKHYDDTSVRTLAIGDDVDWSSNLRAALKRIPESRILFIFDDFIVRSVDRDAAVAAIKLAEEKDWPYLTLYPNNYREGHIAPGISAISEHGTYRCTLVYGLIRKDVLERLLVDGENAWEFELKGGKRARGIALYSVNRRIFRHYHLLRKGRWMQPGYGRMVKLGYALNPKRPVESFPAYVARETKEFLFRQYHRRLPPRLIERLERRR